jgi:hypothetical protein
MPLTGEQRDQSFQVGVEYLCKRKPEPGQTEPARPDLRNCYTERRLSLELRPASSLVMCRTGLFCLRAAA